MPLRENTSSYRHRGYFLSKDTSSSGNSKELTKTGLHQIEKLQHSEGDNDQSE
jgi:hypothetical protein